MASFVFYNFLRFLIMVPNGKNGIYQLGEVGTIFKAQPIHNYIGQILYWFQVWLSSRGNLEPLFSFS